MPAIDGVLKLSGVEEAVLGVVLESWPASALDVAHHFREDLSTREAKRKASTKYSYYLQKLMEKRLVLGKRVGNAIVVWPLVVEKYRTIHNILRD